LEERGPGGETSIHGLVNSCGFRQTIGLAVEQSGWKEKRKKKPEGKKKYGIGMACAIHVAGNRNVVKLYDGSSATVNLDKTGKIRVLSGELDIGQGSETVFTQIVAEELGVPIEDIRVLPVDTEISPFALGTFGDRITVLGGQAVRMASADAKSQF
jgi:CO/xanthine dehydrogenase Mo-binding subunit